MIEYIATENIRGVRKMRLSLERVTVVCGRPGSGKSLPLRALQAVSLMGTNVTRAIQAADGVCPEDRTENDGTGGERRLQVGGRFRGARRGRGRDWTYEARWNTADPTRLIEERLAVCEREPRMGDEGVRTGTVAGTDTKGGVQRTTVHGHQFEQLASMRSDGRSSILGDPVFLWDGSSAKAAETESLARAADIAAPEYEELKTTLGASRIQAAATTADDVAATLRHLYEADRDGWERVCREVWPDRTVERGGANGPAIRTAAGATYGIWNEASSRVRLAGIAAAAASRSGDDEVYLLEHADRGLAIAKVAAILKTAGGTGQGPQLVIETDEPHLAAEMLMAPDNGTTGSWRFGQVSTPWEG